MKNSTLLASDSIRQYLKVYEMELVGKVLVNRLHLPILIIGGIFVFLYFGMLLILNSIDHRLPTTIRELFNHPLSEYDFYYPNLLAIAFDLIGHPLFFVFLIVLRYYIPLQIIELEQNKLIKERLSSSWLIRFIQCIAKNNLFQIITILIIPVLLSSVLAWLYWDKFPPTDVAKKYAIFLVLLGYYVKISIIFQIVYIFLILTNYTVDVKLKLLHPDRCSGYAPFGNLAIVIYLFLFFWAIIQAIGISAGGGPVEAVIKNTTGPVGLLYLWLFFPFVVLYVFERLVYRPHRAIKKIQQEYLEIASQRWTNYHQQIHSKFITNIYTSESEKNWNFCEDLKLLETSEKLEKYILDMPTWPISQTTFRLIVIVVNPFVPIFLPGITSFIKYVFNI